MTQASRTRRFQKEATPGLSGNGKQCQWCCILHVLLSMMLLAQSDVAHVQGRG